MAALFAVVAFAPAATAQQLKIGHVDFNALVASLPETKAAEKEVEDRRTAIAEMLEKLYAEVGTLFQAYQKNAQTYAADTRKAKEEEIRQKQQEIQTLEELGDQQLQNLWQEKMNPVYERVRKAIEAVGGENGFIYILETSTLNYISPKSTDVTDLVKKKLGVK